MSRKRKRSRRKADAGPPARPGPAANGASEPAGAAPPCPAPAAPLADIEQEVDVWLGGYAGRTQLPSTLVLLVLTGVFLGLVWSHLDEVDPDYRSAVNLGAFVLAGLVWLVQALRWGYRKVLLGIRLTTRRLFYGRGGLFPTGQVVSLLDVTGVEVRQRFLERLLGVGRVIIFRTGGKPVVLAGVAHPSHLAATISLQVNIAKELHARTR